MKVMRRTGGQKWSVVFAGEAGAGIDRTAVVFGRILMSFGFNVFIYRDYASLIRGGHNFSVVTFSSGPVRSHEDRMDLLVAFDKNSVDTHKSALKTGGKILIADDFGCEADVILSQKRLVKEEGANSNFGNNIALGAAAKFFRVPFSAVCKAIKASFSQGEEARVAIKLARAGYASIISGAGLKKGGAKTAILMDGSEGAARGTLASGGGKAFFYPMTPSTGYFSALHNLGGEVRQADDEIAAANMALGSSFSEGLAITGSSGGGLALMAEAFSFAGMAELPIVIYAAQRQGPSTGVPTYSGQGDMKFVLNIAPGEFPKVVSVPGDAEEAYYRAAEASYLARKFRTQSFILSDKHIAESYFSTPKLSVSSQLKKGFITRPRSNYKSYELTENGVSPAALPGGGAIIRATSYEHDEFGFTTEDPEMITVMNKKRLRKAEAIRDEVKKFNPVSVYGAGRKLLIFSGSPKGAVLDALPDLSGVRVMQIHYLEPFPAEEVAREIKKASMVLTIESNVTGLLSQIIAEKTGYFTGKILKYNGRPFTADEIVLKVKKFSNESLQS